MAPGVIDALGRLRNTRYHDRPVSRYGGINDRAKAMIVTRSRLHCVRYHPALERS